VDLAERGAQTAGVGGMLTVADSLLETVGFRPRLHREF